MRMRKDMLALIAEHYWMDWRCPYCCAQALVEGTTIPTSRGYVWEVFFCGECRGDFAVHYSLGSPGEALAVRRHPTPAMEE